MKDLNPHKRVEILLVEDDAQAAEKTIASLRSANIVNRVHLLEDGHRVLDFLLRTGSYAGAPPLPAEMLVLLSLGLKKTHGLDVLKKIKNDARTSSLPVIILSATQEERGVMQSYKLGASGCLVKPIDLAKFMEAAAELRLHWLLVDGAGE